MSLLRLIIWSGLIGGWAAFLGWIIPELVFGRFIDQASINENLRTFLAILMAMIVAIPIGGGVCLASGLTSPQWAQLLKRLLMGFAGGFAGGAAEAGTTASNSIAERIPLANLSIFMRASYSTRRAGNHGAVQKRTPPTIFSAITAHRGTTVSSSGEANCAPGEMTGSSKGTRLPYRSRNFAFTAGSVRSNSRSFWSSPSFTPSAWSYSFQTSSEQ